MKLTKNNYTFRTVIEPDDPKGYHGYVPTLPGVHTCGDTLEEVKRNLREAISCHIEALIKDGEDIPQDKNSVEAIETFTEADFAKVNYA